MSTVKNFDFSKASIDALTGEHNLTAIVSGPTSNGLGHKKIVTTVTVKKEVRNGNDVYTDSLTYKLFVSSGHKSPYVETFTAESGSLPEMIKRYNES